MRVAILGTGSALPSPRRVQTGIHIRDGSSSLLVDCGSGIVHRLAQAGIDHESIETVLLTHHHLDHIADLPTLLKARWLDDHPTLNLYGPPGTNELATHLFSVDSLTERTDVSVDDTTLDDFPLTIEGIPIDAAEAEHSQLTHAYRFGDALAFSSDTEPTSAVMNLADGVHTLIHECAYPDAVSAPGHTSPTELGEALSDIAVEQVILTHLFPQAETIPDQLAKTVSHYTDIPVYVANDLTTLDIPD